MVSMVSMVSFPSLPLFPFFPNGFLRMASPPSGGKEGWLKAGVVGAPICFNNRLMYSPTTSPYGDSSFPKEENGDRFASSVALPR
ncbi:hypothetical protein [Bacteroides caccae]|uniref:hypothetical protein n=1 Tax=Bacteroides caccae TaxID=47678 RepID=UPI001C706368|nr:hypothetical protein [Bacteroides caccae]